MSSSSDQTMEIVILETSDVHGYIVPYSYADGEEVESGLSHLAKVIERERSQGEASCTLLIDNGDCIQGSPLTYYQAKVDPSQPNAAISCMNQLRYEAAVPGNHEFNFGLEYLHSVMEQSSFPWLAANVICSENGEPLFGKPYRIWELPQGIRLAVLGLTTSYIPNWEQPKNIGGIDFVDVVESAKRWIPFLRDQEQVDIVIVSYHGGLERDPDTGEPTEPLTGENRGYALCTEVPGIDVLLTGHQHRQLSGLNIEGVCVIQPGHEGKMLGKITLLLEKRGNKWILTEKRSELISGEGYEPDQTLLELIAPTEQALQKWLDQPIGEVQGDMTITNSAEARIKKHPFIEWINQVQMEISGAQLSCTALLDEAAPGFGSKITMRDIITNYKYPNTLRVLRLSGTAIKAALERSADYFILDDEGRIDVNPDFLYPKIQHYNYDMWEGLEYTIDVSRPYGGRVVGLMVDGEPLAPDAEYDVVMNNYRASGGGDYLMFQGKPVLKDIPVDMVELLADYIRQKRVIEAKLTPTWKVVAGEAG